MASSVIHMCVAKKINEKLKFDEQQLYLGSIAPDIWKYIDFEKSKTHFLDDPSITIPNLDKFLNKYRNSILNPFIMGYYIHLYTDYLWFKYFISEVEDKEKGYLKLINGCIASINNPEGDSKYIYNDYSDISTELIDKYELDLDLFFEDNKLPSLNMDEILIDRLQVIIDQAGILISNAKETKSYVFDISNVSQFIDTSTEIILGYIDELIS